MKFFKVSINASENVIVTRCVKAGNPWQRLRGLMGIKSMADDYAMYFPGVSAIHTFFMSCSIDVIWIDSKGCILKLCHNLKPWRAAFGPRSSSVIEVGAGRIAALGIIPNQVVIFPDKGWL